MQVHPLICEANLWQFCWEVKTEELLFQIYMAFLRKNVTTFMQKSQRRLFNQLLDGRKLRKFPEKTTKAGSSDGWKA
jgi:hypothetical protein